MAVVTHVFPPWTGGAEFYHDLISRALAEEAEVCVFTADLLLRTGVQGGRLVEHGEPEAAALPYQVLYLPSWTFFGENLLRPWTLLRALRRFDPDVIWGNFPSLSSDFGGLFGMLRKVPWVATYHADLNSEHVYGRVFAVWEGRLLRRAAAVLVTTPRYAARLAGRGVLPGRVHVTPLGPGIGLGHPPEVNEIECPTPTAAGPDHPFLFVGGLDKFHAYKRPERLLQALGQLRADGVPVCAVIVGDGDRRRELEDQSARAGLTGHVRFLGRLTDRELACRYRTSWAIVLPSTDTEGFGVVAIEAVHYGCPVLCSEGPGIGPMLVESGAGMVYDDGDAGALERSLRALWSDPGLRQRLADRTSTAAGLFDWGKALPQLTAPILSAGSAHAEGR